MAEPTGLLPSFALGAGLAFAAVVQPGPLQAFLLSRAATEGWRRTLPAAFSPLLSDGPIALLAVLLLSRFPPAAQSLLRAAGGVLLLYLAGSSLRALRAGADAPEPDRRAAPKTLFQAAAVNLLNPNPYLAWALVLGPAAVSAWRIRPVNAVALLLSFYGVMVTGLAAFIVLASGARSLPPRARRAVALAAAAILAGLGLWMLGTGLAAIASA
ncbi:MAG TPA: LysE family transporter [Thermoanaerobaculia bacterium]|nr:LysE family transporter [Thermoanaerobaculia bacterium]HQR66214.1 LysE family transporter [Thermoanaerobaculia bacterium]